MSRVGKELLEKVKGMALESLFFFGYVKREDNPCGAFDVDEASPEIESLLNGFTSLNERSMAIVTGEEIPDPDAPVFTLNDGKELTYRQKHDIPAFPGYVFDVQSKLTIQKWC